jgi:hypothetical protein
MARPFAYAPGASMSGVTMVGNLGVGTGDLPWADNPGGYRWWNGPDESSKYIIAHPVASLDQPNPLGVTAGIGFWGTKSKTEESFLSLVNALQPRLGHSGFSTGASASSWLTQNGYWNSFESFVNPTLTIGSAVSVASFSPFTGGGNSYLFSSSVNSYITTPGSSDWAVGTGDFTAEWFSYQTTLTQFQRAFTVGDYPSITIGVSIESGTFYYWANSSFRYSSSGASTANTWIHWAVVRISGVTRVYRNGNLLGSSISDTNNITNTSTAFVVGNTNLYATNAALVGYLTNFRWVKGLGVYTGNFTVPTSPLTATATANPYGGSNTQAIGSGLTKLLLVP